MKPTFKFGSTRIIRNISKNLSGDVQNPNVNSDNIIYDSVRQKTWTDFHPPPTYERTQGRSGTTD